MNTVHDFRRTSNSKRPKSGAETVTPSSSLLWIWILPRRTQQSCYLLPPKNIQMQMFSLRYDGGTKVCRNLRDESMAGSPEGLH